MCKSHTNGLRADWTQGGVVTEVSGFLQNTRRAHLRKELASFLGCSTSKTDKLVLGDMERIQAHDLLNMNAHFNGELVRTLLGYNEDEAKRRIAEHLEAIRRLTA